MTPETETASSEMVIIVGDGNDVIITHASDTTRKSSVIRGGHGRCRGDCTR